MQKDIIWTTLALLLSASHLASLATELDWDLDTAGVHHGLIPVLGGAARLELRPALRLARPSAVLHQRPRQETCNGGINRALKDLENILRVFQ